MRGVYSGGEAWTCPVKEDSGIVWQNLIWIRIRCWRFSSNYFVLKFILKRLLWCDVLQPQIKQNAKWYTALTDYFPTMVGRNFWILVSRLLENALKIHHVPPLSPVLSLLPPCGLPPPLKKQIWFAPPWEHTQKKKSPPCFRGGGDTMSFYEIYTFHTGVPHPFLSETLILLFYIYLS